MKVAHFHFDDGLRPLLPRAQRAGDFEYRFSGPQSIKHLIESLGVPHTELGLLQANNHVIGLDYLVRDGDQLQVHLAVPDVNSSIEPRFVLDGHLGRLTAYLRMLGLDCLYRNDYDDRQLARISMAEDRRLLTRDRRLLMHKSIKQGYLLRSLDPRGQLREAVRRYGLEKWIKPFQRCLRCNHPLVPVSKQEVLDRLEPLTKLYFEEFRICRACNQIYWKGSHFDKMQRLISSLNERPSDRQPSD